MRRKYLLKKIRMMMMISPRRRQAVFEENEERYLMKKLKTKSSRKSLNTRSATTCCFTKGTKGRRCIQIEKRKLRHRSILEKLTPETQVIDVKGRRLQTRSAISTLLGSLLTNDEKK
jgi:hypothetical protein